jgi:AcrR family transcriptional regulator
MDDEDRHDGRKERATRRRSHRRTEILAASRKVFSDKGYHASSVADIIAEAGIARGTFYLYFPSKRALFEELLEEMISQIAGVVHRITTDGGLDSALDQLSVMVRRVIEILETNRHLTIILLREAVGLDADFDLKLNAFYSRMSDLIDGALRLGQSMGLVRECDTRLASYCVLGSLKEVMLQQLTGGGLEVDSEELARGILDFNLRGLFKPTP